MTAGAIAAPTIIPLKVSKGPKHIIDSTTRIEISSATSDTLIFYTLDKSRPNPMLKYGSTKEITHRYKEPFKLFAGKVTVKAMACCADMSKESAVVTKNFTVLEAEDLDSSDTSEEEPDAGVEESPSQPPSISAQLRHRLSMGSRSSMLSSGGGGSDLDTSPTNLQKSKLPFNGSSRSLAQSSVKSVGQASVMSAGQGTAVSGEPSVERPAVAEIPKPYCLYCKYPRSKAFDQRFCTHCGSHLPPLPEASPKPPLQVAVCSRCRAHLPLDSTSCLVCEHSVLHPSPIPLITAQTQAQAQHKLDDKLVCLVCGTRNRVDSTHCWTCERPLPPETQLPPSPTHTPPPLPTPIVLRPISGSSYMMCGVCGRVNVSDARFCDWCGGKPASSQLMVACVSCQTPNEWHCRYCHSCGGIIKAPLRPEVELASTMKMPASVELDKNAWIPVVEIADRGPETGTHATQTDGIFYPSSRTIANQKGTEFIKKMIHTSARDRLPKLQSHSPGKGYWRMQLEHVCTHLKAHTQSSPSFQDALGKPQLGKLISAEIQDDTERVDVRLSFAVKQVVVGSTSLLKRSSSCGDISSTNTTPTTQSAETTPTKKTSVLAPPEVKPPKPQQPPQQQHYRRRSQSLHKKTTSLTGETKKLFKELLENGQGRKDVVAALIEKGADVNAVVPESGVPLLSLACASGHVQCIATLVDRGARINTQSKTSGNTALHETVLQGPSTIPCIEALLGHGADAKKRNADGLTPCDLAMKLKHDQIVTCFATYVGAGLLDNLYKYQPSLTL